MHTTKQRKNKCDIWPIIWLFNNVLKVVKIHVHAKLHQAKCTSIAVSVF